MLECGMLERDRQTIRRCSVVLCKQLVVDAMLIQSLQADDILTESMAESILGEQTSQKRSWHLLQLLPKRGPRAFRSFCAALRETEQQHLCDLLTQSPERDGREAQLKRFVDPSLPFPTQEVIAAKRARTRESMEFSLDADSPINSPVLPCTSDFYLSHCQQSYRMNSSPRGFALVISNVTFDPCAAPDLDPRKGGEVDDEVLRKVLTELDYLVTVHRDLTAQGIRTCIEKFCRRSDHRTVDSCVVCLLSHGVDGAVYGTDGQVLQLDWVFEAFDNAHCPLLQNKPKMFFIQACRGGTAAMRNTKRGSWFIQELNTALRLHAKDTHLADILVQVNRNIKEREGYAPGTAHHRCKEMSEFTSSLCKDLYLFPKYPSQY